MALSGKYDFPGLKSKGALGLRAAFLSSPATAWISKLPFSGTILEFIANYLANKGLIILNIGAIYVNGAIDQGLLDRSIDEGLKAVENSKGNLTPDQIKDIDDAVIKAADRALPYSSKPTNPDSN